MKILHFSSMAGVSEILSKESIALGHESFVIQKRELDPFGFGDFYRTNLIVDRLDTFVEQLNSGSKDADVVIVHDWIEFLDEIECDKIFVFFHGSKLRTLPPEQLDIIRGKVDGIFVSTPDLLEQVRYGHHIPAPVDLDLFKDKGESRSWNQLTINRNYQKDFIEPAIKKEYPECVYYVRSTSKPIRYELMPEILNKWKSYVDMKYDYSKPEPKLLDAYSTTAVQALACGCEVYNGLHKKLPKSLVNTHDGKRVTKEFLKLIG